MNPSSSDLQERFNRAACCMQLKMYREAIPDLQRARQHPQLRRDAMKLLVKAFIGIGRKDLAIKISDDSDEDDDGSTSSGIPAPLRPLSPKAGFAAKKLPPEHEQDA